MPTDTLLALGWLFLLGAVFALLVPIGMAAWWQHRRERPSRGQRQAELSEWVRHAAVVTERAGQAAAEAEEARDLAVEAERRRAEAWSDLEPAERACQEAERVHRELRLRQAEHLVDPATQREVVAAALAAYRRGDLSQEQLWRVWRWGSGWSPDQERQEHELAQLRAAQREAQLRYQVAADAERAAVRRAEVADAQARALLEEAVLAETEIAAARDSGRGGSPAAPAR